MIRVAITGICGRMGQCITQGIAGQVDMELVGAIQYPGHPQIGSDAGVVAGVGEIGVPVTGELEDMLESAGVIIEFSKPEAAVQHLQQAVDADKAIVIGTTGFSTEQSQNRCSKRHSPPFSGNCRYSVRT